MPATRVLLVCLANICRSPLAEAAFRRERRSYRRHDGISLPPASGLACR
ncbi:arsenate reductase/protein-tyrosine-phosphatase family protein [Sphingomonas sp. Leaf357]|nr:hypothetical protein [Sphingomonas sp. Leaf357]